MPGDVMRTGEDQETHEASQASQLEMDKVQPLLAAYDATITRLQAKLQDRQEEVLRVEHHLEQISTENSGLLENLKTAMQEAATNVRFH